MALLAGVLNAQCAHAEEKQSAAAIENEHGLPPITGTVRDAEGKPILKAQVALFAVTSVDDIRMRGRQVSKVLAQSATDEAGRFRLAVEKLPAGRIDSITILATADGHGSDWVRPNFDDPPLEFEFQLPAEHRLKGRLLSAEGRPAVGVKVRIQDVAKFRSIEDVYFGKSSDLPVDLFPFEFTTDAEGGFSIGRLAPGMTVSFLIQGQESYPSCMGSWSADKTTELTFTLPEAHVITGEVVAADTGLPLADAVVTVGAGGSKDGVAPLGGQAVTDAQGKFRLTTAVRASNLYQLTTHAPAGSSYLDNTLLGPLAARYCRPTTCKSNWNAARWSQARSSKKPVAKACPTQKSGTARGPIQSCSVDGIARRQRR